MRLPALTLILVILFSLIIDIYIWQDIRKGKSLSRWKRSEVYAVSSILLWIFLIVAVCLPHRNADSGISHIMWMLTAYASVYISKIVYIIFSLIGRIPSIFRCRSWLWIRYAGVIAAILMLVYTWYGILHTRHQTQIIDVTLLSSRLPDGFDGYRIVQISDLHLGSWGKDTTFLSKLVSEVNAQKPDIVVFTGDIVNRKADELDPFISTLATIDAKDGVYSILGNHDYGDYVDWASAKQEKTNLENLKNIQKNCGWKMLNNEHIFLFRTTDTHTDSIALIGVENWGEPPFGQYGDLDVAYPTKGKNHLNDNNFKILLTHNPEHWLREIRMVSNIDLSLSGHTHAMQMSIDAFGRRWSPSALRYKTWGGFYTSDSQNNIIDYGNPSGNTITRNLDNPSIYVNIGAGEVGMPFRLGSCIPEITVTTLKKK